MKPLLPFLFSLCLFMPASLPAHETLKPLRVSVPPVIDGVLDDAAWQEAQQITDFKTFFPDFGKAPSEQTLAYMAYDAENLYFAFLCHDRSPDKVKASMASRRNIGIRSFIITFSPSAGIYSQHVRCHK